MAREILAALGQVNGRAWLFGAVGAPLRDALSRCDAGPPTLDESHGPAGWTHPQTAPGPSPGGERWRAFSTLKEAVTAAFQGAAPGDLVLFSPAFASFDAYPNFRARAAEFQRLAQQLAPGQRDEPTRPRDPAHGEVSGRTSDP